MSVRGLGGVCGLAALFAWFGHGLGLGQTPTVTVPAIPAPSPAPSRTLRATAPTPVATPAIAVEGFLGAGRCSATACHGAARPAPARDVAGAYSILRNEHTTWIQNDPHAEAYGVLFNERSVSISSKLPGPRPPAHQDARCLACHSTPSPPPAAGRPAALLADGVGCESCHGPSRHWIDRHTAWQRGDVGAMLATGMTPTADLVRRAEACAGCHVGSPALGNLPRRDVDHDLIAAGHPRLNFEFSAFQANMPRHWRNDVGPDAAPDYPARCWSVGQVVAARAALDLLRDRALRAKGDEAEGRPTAWPEFSEFGCFSCHRPLTKDPSPATPPDVGRPRWGSWHFPLLTTLTRSKDDPFAAELAKLRRVMGETRPDPAEVAALAGSASRSLGQWLEGVSRPGLGAGRVREMWAAVASLADAGTVKTWDEATQRYLALVPLSQSLRSLAPGADDARRDADLERLRRYLQFRDGFDSPSPYRPGEAPKVR